MVDKERRRLARRGAELLRSKRQALAAELFAVVRDVLRERGRLDERLRTASRALALARAIEGEETLASLALATHRDALVDVEMKKVWGVPIPEVSGPPLARAADARGASPLDLGFGAAETAVQHEIALELALGICSKEIRLRRVGEEIRSTSRRISALEEIVVPALAREIRRIALVLEERDREDLTRLKRFKSKRR
jgi:V/A-type H+-transporting ATPase subunit D